MFTSILESSRKIRNREISPVELTRECLARIAKLNPTLNAFITVTAESALLQAQQAEAEIQHGRWRGPLHGIPIAVKDLIDTAGVRTTAASALFKDRVPLEDADVIQRLQHAGTILLGKQNLHEFAYGGSSIIGYFREVKNAWNTAYIAGGSSGGASAVAAGLGYAAIGTDTAGSVREPAALCGVVGLKPTYGRVSTRGVIPLSWSLDHVGPITRTVADAVVMLQAIAGHDPRDPNSANVAVDDYLAALHRREKKIRIGVPRNFFFEDLDPEIASACDQALGVLTTHCGEMVEIDLPVPTDRTLQSAEAYAYHAEYVARSPELYQADTLRRIRTGENISAGEVAERRRELHQIRSEIRGLFDKIDVLATPTTPIAAPLLAELKENPGLLRPCELTLLRNTRPFNVWGLPAISVPCGFTRSGLPIGLQIAAAHWAEADVLLVAHVYEQATSWHNRQPSLL
ncbi:MAG TPA: amidase [Terriglobales bacterium]|nr:amidase [Terriglobales bacterium]